MTEKSDYLLEGYVCITAASETEAVRLFEEAGLGCQVEPIPGVLLDFQGPWDAVEPIIEPSCTCPPALVARGGFRSSCEAHR